MSVTKYGKIDNWDDLNAYVQDLYNNLGLEDLRPADVRTDAPTTATLNKGRFAIVELSGVPYVYYLSLSGVLYKKQMDAA